MSRQRDDNAEKLQTGYTVPWINKIMLVALVNLNTAKQSLCNVCDLSLGIRDCNTKAHKMESVEIPNKRRYVVIYFKP